MSKYQFSARKVPVTRSGSVPVNVTEHVKRMYDALVNSMDWGSGFMDTETVETVLVIGRLLGDAAMNGTQLDSEALASKAGFREPAPTTPIDGNFLDNDWYNRYRAWQSRKRSVIEAWARQVVTSRMSQMGAL